jgi:hypothetical protein
MRIFYIFQWPEALRECRVNDLASAFGGRWSASWANTAGRGAISLVAL